MNKVCRILIPLCFLACLTFSLFGCSDDGKVVPADDTGSKFCTPYDKQACTCDGGMTGLQTCAPGGQFWGLCICKPDNDTGYEDSGAGDAGVDGSMDASDGGFDAGKDAGHDSGPDAAVDSGTDANGHDSGTDSGFDSGIIDAGVDAGPADAGDGISWIQIPAGNFSMGCSPGDSLCQSFENTAHNITIANPFWLMETEVTQKQYLKAIGSNPSYFAACGEDCPVESVTWTQAKYFCTKMGGRLPTESEWEYAARAGTTTKFYCGNGGDVHCPDEYAWFSINSESKTHPYKLKTANAWGLSDMLGNVFEWV
ncbi:MAG: formylglycine-generating enzyme family protein, partial [Myxococcota bacterium]